GDEVPVRAQDGEDGIGRGRLLIDLERYPLALRAVEQHHGALAAGDRDLLRGPDRHAGIATARDVARAPVGREDVEIVRTRVGAVRRADGNRAGPDHKGRGSPVPGAEDVGDQGAEPDRARRSDDGPRARVVDGYVALLEVGG